MFSRIERLNGPRSGRRVIVLLCDHCGKERRVNYAASTLEKYKCKLAFCGRDCQISSQKRGGLLREIVDDLFIKRYGVITPLNLEQSRQKLNHALQNGGLNNTKATLVERYDVVNPMNIPGVAAKVQSKIRANRDGLHHLETEISLNKRQKTCLERYGVDHPMRCADIVNRFPFKEVWQKSHSRKKENGTYVQSSSERKFGAWLICVFGKNRVQRGVLVNGWSIDFVVQVDESTAVYIQYDGVYWHGLDANEDIIKVREGPRARRIVKVFERDKEQNAWFKEHERLLYRITDKVFERYLKRYGKQEEGTKHIKF